MSDGDDGDDGDAEWASEPRPSSNILRLIYQGRFLHGNVTLAGIVALH